MKKRTENIIIFVMAGAMMFTSLGAGLILLIPDDDNPSISNSSENPIVIDENGNVTTANNEPVEAPEPLPTPEVFIPEADVTAIQTTDVKVGDGAEVALGDTITVHYHGTLASDGTVFDSSFTRGQPATFDLLEGRLIEGWTEGIPGMKVGGTRRLVIPSNLAYGANGSPPTIGADADLVFVVELVEATKPTAQ